MKQIEIQRLILVIVGFIDENQVNDAVNFIEQVVESIDQIL